MQEKELLENILGCAVDAARAAGKRIMEVFDSESGHDLKTTSFDIVTQADKDAETLITRIIQERFPEHSILGEEGASKQGSAPYTWVIDPVDGTSNFSKRYPRFCVSIGIALGKDPVAGVIFDPVKDEMLTAAKGAGAFLNDKPIKVSVEADLKRAFIASGWPADRQPIKEQYFKAVDQMMDKVLGLRQNGSAALDMADVARGRIDGTLFFDIKSWDAAAGTIIVREAGGFVLDFAGEQWDIDADTMVVTNFALKDEMLEMARRSVE